MRLSKPLTVTGFSVCLLLADCSTDPKLAIPRGPSQVEHVYARLPSGKHQLTVFVTPAMGQSGNMAAELGQGYANDFAARTCPKGYDYYADAPLSPKRSKHFGPKQTYVFQCR